ncbi:MAG: putative response regulator, receiver domain protein [Polaromonas sp.]|nr:putative response regulator, receiver domain protein [Polaromonas sp.]
MAIPTILVEDCKAFRDRLVTSIEESTEVRIVAEAQTPSQALALVAELGSSWELMILDLFLKEGTGLSVLQACRERLPHQHIVVLTNMATPEMKRQCLKLGADEVLDKSSELDRLFERCDLYHMA